MQKGVVVLTLWVAAKMVKRGLSMWIYSFHQHAHDMIVQVQDVRLQYSDLRVLLFLKFKLNFENVNSGPVWNDLIETGM